MPVKDRAVGDRERPVSVWPCREECTDYQLGMVRALDLRDFAGVGDGCRETRLNSGAEPLFYGLGESLDRLAVFVLNRQGERPIDTEVMPVRVDDQLASYRWDAVARDHRQFIGRHLVRIGRLEVDGLPELGAILIGRRAANIDDVRRGSISFNPPESKETHPSSLSAAKRGQDIEQTDMKAVGRAQVAQNTCLSHSRHCDWIFCKPEC